MMRDKKPSNSVAPLALQCADDAGGEFPRDLLNKYRKELGELEQPTDAAEETINALYQHDDQPRSLSSVLNKKFDQWVSMDKGLSILTKLQLPKDLKREDMVPSTGVLEKIAAAVTPESTPAALTGNNLRKQVLFKYWDGQIAPVLAERLVAIAQQGSSDATYTSRLAFVIQMVIEQQEILEAKYSAQLWSHVQTLYGRLSDPSTKIEIHKAVLVFAAACPDTNTKQAATSFAQQNWQTFTDMQLREVLDFLTRFEEQPRLALRKALVQQEFAAVQNELQNPTDRTKQRLALSYENKDALEAKALDACLIKALETQDPAFETWRVLCGEYASRLGTDFSKQVAENCLSLSTSSYSLQRRQSFFELFVTVLPVLDSDAKLQLLPSYFALCKHTDQNIRNPASTILAKVRKEIDEQDFKLSLNPLVRDICRMTPTEVMAFRTVLDATLQHSALFGDNEWRDLADLAKRALPQVDPAIQDYGLFLVERIPKIPAEHESDLIHLLVGIARGTNAAQKTTADKLLRKIPEAELGAKSKKALREYLAPPKAEGKVDA